MKRGCRVEKGEEEGAGGKVGAETEASTRKPDWIEEKRRDAAREDWEGSLKKQGQTVGGKNRAGTPGAR